MNERAAVIKASEGSAHDPRRVGFIEHAERRPDVRLAAVTTGNRGKRVDRSATVRRRVMESEA